MVYRKLLESIRFLGQVTSRPGPNRLHLIKKTDNIIHNGKRFNLMSKMDIATTFFTIATAIFVAELTDKDAILLITLATKIRPLIVFVSGAAAFTITTAIIVTLGNLLTSILPVTWITLSGAAVMIGYAIWKFSKLRRGQVMDDRLESEEKRLLSRFSERRFWSIVLGIIPMLVLLDLAGDATEILTIVFVAQYQDALLVFVGALTALVGATALEITLGNQLSKYLSFKKIQLFSPIVFLIVGLATLITTIF